MLKLTLFQEQEQHYTKSLTAHKHLEQIHFKTIFMIPGIRKVHNGSRALLQ